MQYPTNFEFFQLQTRSKLPLAGDSWPTTPTLSHEQVGRILLQGGNYAVRIGPLELVIDIDPRNKGNENVLRFNVADFPVVLTPSGAGSKHIYMRLPDSRKLHHSLPQYPGIDFQAHGRYVVGAGSTHPNGSKYEFDCFAANFPAGLIPASLLDELTIRQSTTSSPGEWTPAQLEHALSKLDPRRFADHDKWFALMCAAHEATGGEAEDEFVAWSIEDELYTHDEKIIRERWQSLKAGKLGNAGAGTLLHLLVANGVTDLQFDVTEFAAYSAPTAEAETSTAKSSLQDMNERFYVVQEDGKLRILELRDDPEVRARCWVRYTKKDFLEVCQSVYHYPLMEVQQGDKTVQIPLAKRWIEVNAKGKRVYPAGVVFKPEVDAERIGDALNMWRGFAVQPQQGDWSLLQDLTLHTLCRGDAASFEYVLNWLARAVQLPHVPAGTACVFKGIKGIGKGTLGRAFVHLFGPHGKPINSPSQVTGRFNSHLQDCVALFADEAFYAGDKAGERILKALITEPDLMYEAKGLTPHTGRNCIHIVMASNEGWVVPAGLDAERRFAVFEAVEEKRSFDFFDRLVHQLEHGGYEAMLYDLQRRDISHFRVHDVPLTKALADQKIESMDLAEQWVYSLLSSGDWGGLPATTLDDRGGCAILAHDLQNSYIQHMGRRLLSKLPETEVGYVLKKTVPNLKRCRITRPAERIDVASMRPWAYCLPAIDSVKINFTRLLGYDVFAE